MATTNNYLLNLNHLKTRKSIENKDENIILNDTSVSKLKLFEIQSENADPFENETSSRLKLMNKSG